MLNLNFRKPQIFLLSILSLSILFTACKKKDRDIQQPDAAGIMAFNLSPDQNAVGFKIEGRIFTQNPLAFGNYTATYRAIYTGNRTVQAFNYVNGVILDTAAANFENNKYYSSFLFGKNGTYKEVIVQDKIDSLPYSTNKAYVRMVNGYSLPNFTPSIRYTLNDSTEIYNQPLSYTTASSFLEVPAGEVNIEARSGAEVKSSRKINFEVNKVYTLLLIDNVSADSLANPEIKFIVNGFIQP